MNPQRLKLFNVLTVAICIYCFSGFIGKKVTANEMDLEELAYLLVQVEEDTGLPRYLLAAIVSQESYFWPWSLNLNGKSFFAGSKEAAIKQIQKYENFDLGLMQINSQWLSVFEVSPEDALDPTANVLLGSTILNDCIDRHGLVGGIACYHAGDPARDKGQLYAKKVIEKWRDLEGLSGSSNSQAGNKENG